SDPSLLFSTINILGGALVLLTLLTLHEETSSSSSLITWIGIVTLVTNYGALFLLFSLMGKRDTLSELAAPGSSATCRELLAFRADWEKTWKAQNLLTIFKRITFLWLEISLASIIIVFFIETQSESGAVVNVLRGIFGISLLFIMGFAVGTFLAAVDALDGRSGWWFDFRDIEERIRQELAKLKTSDPQ
ncbi:hypothetical protein HY478_03075, partial [Candidatus Uhrbacteria bacterium]|nr:hypothetical protein [Candidatus Uhrbacteria bacterium]